MPSGRIRRNSRGENARAAQVAILDALAQRNGVRDIRAGIEDRGEAVAGQHGLDGACEPGRGSVGRIVPGRFHEVHVAVLKTRRHYAAAAFRGTRALRESARVFLGPAATILPSRMRTTRIVDRRGIGRGVDLVRGVRERQVSAAVAGAETPNATERQ